MTIAELIEALSAYPPATRVVVDGYEGGYDDPIPALMPVVVNHRLGGYYGAHSGWHQDDEGAPTVALSISSGSSREYDPWDLDYEGEPTTIEEAEALLQAALLKSQDHATT